MDERLDELVKELRTRYDYIIADSVPVGIIADATIANRIADLTIFVVRAGKLDRRQLPDIESLYQEKTLNGVKWCGCKPSGVWIRLRIWKLWLREV